MTMACCYKGNICGHQGKCSDLTGKLKAHCGGRESLFLKPITEKDATCHPNC